MPPMPPTRPRERERPLSDASRESRTTSTRTERPRSEATGSTASLSTSSDPTLLDTQAYRVPEEHRARRRAMGDVTDAYGADFLALRAGRTHYAPLGSLFRNADGSAPEIVVSRQPMSAPDRPEPLDASYREWRARSFSAASDPNVAPTTSGGNTLANGESFASTMFNWYGFAGANRDWRTMPVPTPSSRPPPNLDHFPFDAEPGLSDTQRAVPRAVHTHRPTLRSSRFDPLETITFDDYSDDSDSDSDARMWLNNGELHAARLRRLVHPRTASEQSRADVVRATPPYLYAESLEVIEGLMGALRTALSTNAIMVDQTVEEVSESAETETVSETGSEPQREIGECAGDTAGNNREYHCYARWLGRGWWCYFCRRKM